MSKLPGAITAAIAAAIAAGVLFSATATQAQQTPLKMTLFGQKKVTVGLW